MDKRRKPSDTRQKPISKERLSHLASLLELSPDPVMELDLSGNIQYLNPAAKRLLPELPEKGIKHPYLAGWETLAAFFRDKEGIGFRREIKVNDAWYVQSVEYVPASRTIRIYGSDTTERKKAEEALKASEQRLRNFIENLPIGIAVVTPDGRAIQRNKYLKELYGYKTEDAIATTVTSHYYDPKDRGRFLKLVEKGPVSNFEVRLKHDDGEMFWGSLSSQYQTTPSGEKQIVTVVQDITERKKTEEALRTSEQLYRSLFENMLNGFAYCKMLFENNKPQDFIYLGVNSAFETQTGLKNVVGKKVSEVIPGIRKSDPQLFEIYGRVALTGVPERFETFVDALKMWFSISVYSPQKEYFVAVFDVVTERKRAEEALKASEAKFRNLVENAPVGIAVRTTDGRSFERNKAFQEMHGYDSKEELMKVSADGFYCDVEDRKRFLELATRGPVRDFEVRRKRKDGSCFWVSQSTIPFVTESGEHQLIAVVQDIDEKKKAEEALRASEEKFRNLIENAPVGIVVNTVGGRPIERNKAAQEMHGYDSKEEFDRVPVPDLYFDPEDRNRFLESLAKGTVRNFETRHKRKDGSIFWISLTAIPQVGEGGEKQHITISQDIDERKRAEEALKVSEEKFRSLLENAPIGIAVSTPEGRRLEANKALVRMQGFSSKEEYLKARAPDTYYDLEDRKYILALLEKGPVQNYELRRKRKDGSVFWASLSSITYTNTAGEKQLINVIADISERKRVEEELEKSREQLRNLSAHIESAREKERTNIARAIHDELGQTLTALKIDLSWLNKRLSEGQEAQIKKTVEMSNLIDTTIQMVKKISTELRPGVLDDLGLTAAIEWQAQEFQERTGINCKATIKAGDIDIDRELATAVFRILQEALTNVARHAKATRVRVSLKGRARQLVLQVRDNGKGITEKQITQPNSFGLMGIRERARSWNGSAKINGIPGRGTTLTVSIPLGPKEGQDDKDTGRR